MLQFKNKTTALLYVARTEHDHYMIIPPTEGCGCKAYKGYLSEIDEKAAERLVLRKTNLIRAKKESDIDTSKVAALIEQKKQTDSEILNTHDNGDNI
jgi:hypothetical protein